VFTHRTLAVVLLSAVALSACEQAPAPLTDADRDTMRAVVAGFDSKVLAADWPAVVAVYSEDGILMPPNGPAVQGRAAMQTFFSAFPKLTAFKQTIVEAEGTADLAYVRGTYEMTMQLPGSTTPVTDTGKVIGVWRKQADGSWTVVRVAWNSDLPLPTPPG
jgi:ketosteroid isomerase-like protein